MIRLKPKEVPFLLVVLCIFSICLPDVQQVFVLAEANNTQTEETFDAAVSDIFKNDTDISQSISKYLDELPTGDNFTSKAKETLKDAESRTPEDDKHLIKSLLELVFNRGKETLAHAECRPCPPCGDSSTNATTPSPSIAPPVETTTSTPTVAPTQTSPPTTPPAVATLAPTAATAPTAAPLLPGLTLPSWAPLKLPPLPLLQPLTLPPLPVFGASRLSLDEINTTESSTTSTSSRPKIETSTSAKDDNDEDDDDNEDDYSDNEEYSYDYAVFTNRRRRFYSSPVKDRRKRGLNESTPVANEQLFEENVKFLVNDSSLSAKLIESFSLLPKEIPEAQHELAKSILSHFKVTRNGKQANESMLVIGYVLDHFRLIRSGCKVCPACAADIGLRAMRTRGSGGRAPAMRGRPMRGGGAPRRPPMGRAPPMRASPRRPPSAPMRPSSPRRPMGGYSRGRAPPQRGGGGLRSPSMGGFGQRAKAPAMPGGMGGGGDDGGDDGGGAGGAPPGGPGGASGGGGGGGGGGSCGSAPLNSLTSGSGKSGYIVGGVAAQYGEWPSYVFVRSVTGPGWSSTCGGVLVSPTAVLTAAHCVVDSQTEIPRAASAFTITVGEYNVGGRDQAEKSFSVSRVCKASGYSGRGGTVYDYAVLTVAGTVTMSNYVQPACLPESPVPTSGAGAKCFIPGLGATGFTDEAAEHTINAQVLQKMRVQQTSCSVWGHQADASRICFTNAEGRRADSCRGDSGGPVLCLSSSNKWTVVGLVSYGTKDCSGGGSNNFVGVYADVTKLLGTIRSQCGI